MKRYDVILAGGGHNGLTCAAYLARAGLRVLVCERRHVVGGPCAEYEYFPGYRASITNSPGSLEPKVVADLELERHGLTFTHPDPTLMFPFPDGRAFIGWRDRDRVAEQIRRFSARDVDGYAALFDFLNRFAERLGVSLFEAPPTLRVLASRLETPEDEEAFARVFPRQRRRSARRVPRIRAPQVDARHARGHVELGEPAVPRLRHVADDASDVAGIVERRRRARPAAPGPARLHGASARGDGEHRAGHAPLVRGRRRGGAHGVRGQPDPRRRRSRGRRCAGGRRRDRRRHRGLEPRSVDDVSRPDRCVVPGARVPRRGRAAAAAGLGVQGGAGPRRHPRLRRRSARARAGLRGMPVPDRAQHRVPGPGVRRREARPAVAGPGVSGGCSRAWRTRAWRRPAGTS